MIHKLQLALVRWIIDLDSQHLVKTLYTMKYIFIALLCGLWAGFHLGESSYMNKSKHLLAQMNSSISECLAQRDILLSTNGRFVFNAEY